VLSCKFEEVLMSRILERDVYQRRSRLAVPGGRRCALGGHALPWCRKL